MFSKRVQVGIINAIDDKLKTVCAVDLEKLMKLVMVPGTRQLDLTNKSLQRKTNGSIFKINSNNGWIEASNIT